MYFILILFFASLIAIIFMIGRKLLMLQNGHIIQKNFEGGAILRVPALEEWRHLTIKGAKKHGYNALVSTIRFYFRTSNTIKNKYHEVKTGVTNMRKKNQAGAEKREISKFLKVISEYKKKIRRIKQKVKEEENL